MGNNGNGEITKEVLFDLVWIYHHTRKDNYNPLTDKVPLEEQTENDTNKLIEMGVLEKKWSSKNELYQNEIVPFFKGKPAEKGFSIENKIRNSIVYSENYS